MTSQIEDIYSDFLFMVEFNFVAVIYFNLESSVSVKLNTLKFIPPVVTFRAFSRFTL